MNKLIKTKTTTTKKTLCPKGCITIQRLFPFSHNVIVKGIPGLIKLFRLLMNLT